MKLIIAALILSILPVFSLAADSLSFKYGVGVIDGSPTTEVKAFALRLESPYPLPLYTALETGLWSDTGSRAGRKGAAYGTYQLGVRPASQHIYMKAFWGVAGLSSTDSQL